MHMYDAFILAGLVIFGAALGSFAGAQVWRLRARQLVEDKTAGEEVDGKEYKRLLPLTKHKGRQDRSIDLDTGKRLPWYDMIPIVSWLMLRGKSRFSGKPIGWFELLMELGVAAFFVVSYLVWPVALDNPLAVMEFALWLAAGVTLAILFAYDTKWFLLPDKINFTVVGLGVAMVIVAIVRTSDISGVLMNTAGSVAILSGLYLLLYLISKGAWIGFGDIKLGLGLGLLLADWQLAFLALFAANLIGTILVLPALIAKKMERGTHVPFGPLLILGAVIAKLWGEAIIAAYMSLFAL